MKLTLLCTLLLATCWNQPTIAETYPPGKETLYYGFFFSETVASSIKNLTDTYFKVCLQKIPEFKAFMESAIANSSVTDIDKYFTKPLDPNTLTFDPFYHVTAKYCGDADCSEYRNKIETQLNKTFVMNLIGYYFTNRTFGVRIKLTSEQELVYDNYGKRWDNSEQLLPEVDIKNVKLQPLSLPGISLESNLPLDLTPTTNIAHITLGVAPKISAVTTGIDLGEIISFETNMAIPRANTSIELGPEVGDDLSGTGGVIVHYIGGYQFGDAFVIYPSVKILASATFEPYLKPGLSSSSPPVLRIDTLAFLIQSIFGLVSSLIYMVQI